MKVDVLVKLGRLTVAWSSLDYVLRLALKRLEGISMWEPRSQEEKQRIDEIFGKLTHGNLISQLKKVLATKPKPEVERLIDNVGESRNGSGLYARRSRMSHALWAITPDGQSVQQRIGASEWKEPLQISEADIEQLIADITNTTTEIDRLTR